MQAITAAYQRAREELASRIIEPALSDAEPRLGSCARLRDSSSSPRRASPPQRAGYKSSGARHVGAVRDAGSCMGH